MPTLLQLAQSYTDPESHGYKLAWQKAYLDDLLGDKKLGELAFADQVQLAMLGTTVIQGGYLRTELIKAGSIFAEHLAVDDLSAISGYFTNLFAGNYPGGAYMRFYESSNNPFIEMFDSAELRVKMEKDRISWYKGSATPKARMIVGESPEGGGNFLSLLSDVADGGVLMGAIRGSAKSYIWVAQSDQFVRLQSTNGVMLTLSGPDQKATWQNCWTYHWGDFQIGGALSKGSGSFLIDHPLDPDNKDLLHGFIEGPRYDLLYRGEATLHRGTVTIDIDVDSSMTTGTFDVLTQNAKVVSLCNQTGYARLKPSAVKGGRFTVTCEDPMSSDVITWVVLAERADPFIKYGDKRTDEDGHLIPEHYKEALPAGKLRSSRDITEAQDFVGYKGYKRHPEAYNRKLAEEKKQETGESNE